MIMKGGDAMLVADANANMYYLCDFCRRYICREASYNDGKIVLICSKCGATFEVPRMFVNPKGAKRYVGHRKPI